MRPKKRKQKSRADSDADGEFAEASCDEETALDEEEDVAALAPSKKTKSSSNTRKTIPRKARALKAEFSTEEMTKAFCLLDHDKDGVLCLNDLIESAIEIKEEFTMEALEDMLTEADSKHRKKGFVNLEDFLQMMSIIGLVRPE